MNQLTTFATRRPLSPESASAARTVWPTAAKRSPARASISRARAASLTLSVASMV
jgi:hypothetical protein